MAITLVLSQVVGQAFVVKPDGQVSPAQANMQLHTGDLISVPKGKNAWLVTEDEEQVDVLDEALLLGDEGFNSLDLPSDVLDIIASLEQGDDPTQLEGKETAAGEELSDSSFGAQVIIEATGSKGGTSNIETFNTVSLREAGVTGAQIESLSSARYANLINRESNEQEENIEAQISGDVSVSIADGDVLTASGNLSSTDVDGADNRFIAETISTPRGELSINENGSWSYSSTDPTGAFRALGEGDTLNEDITVRAVDGSEQRITLTFEGNNDVPVFSAINTGEITERDGALNATGSINITDPDAGESFIQAGSFDGEWGTVTIDRAGNWTYTTNDSSHSAIKSLTDGEKLTDTITVYSVDGSETQISITINGANDDAVIGGDITATVTDNNGTLATSGTLTSTDIDGNDNAFIAETITTPRGEVTIAENGNWTFTSTDPTGAIKLLPEGETLTEVVTVRAEDGTEQQIVLTIEGVNDAPVFSAITTRDVYEANDVISVSGSLNVVDPDVGESFMLAGSYLGDFGAVTIDRAGNWTYTTDPAQSTALDTLKEGEQRVDTITVRSVDGTETDILVTIIGTNDPAQIAGDIVGTIVEADGTMTTSGQLSSTDVDGNSNTFTAQTVEGRWGDITIEADGSWTYVTTDDKGAINRMGDGEQLTDTLSVRAEDGTVQTITITIDGTNDAAVFGGMTNVSVNEADGQLTTNGRATISDADYGEYFFQAGTFTGDYGDITIDKAGNWSYTTDPVHSNTFDALDAGDQLPDTITVYAQDGTPLDITVTITGTDDLPVVSGQFGQSLVDTTTGNTLTTSGTINISDVDADDAPTFEDTRIESEYGVLELVDGNWTYTLDKEAASALNAGEIDTDVITLTASDGTQQNIVISITGTNDAPVLSGDTTGSLSDDDNLTISGSIEIIDPDTGDSPTVPNDTIDGSYGTLALLDGEWTYTLDPDSTASLPEGERTTDTITITASDGSTHDIVITITGTDQLPVLEGDTTGAIKEGSSTLIATGTINLVDVDEGQTPTLPNGTTEGAYGSLELIDGAWAYTLDPELAQYLDEGQTTQDTISVTASDGTVHDIVITITGSEDAAVLSGETSGSVSDETGALTTGGSLSISDPDTNDNPTLPDSNQQGQYGSFSMMDGNWTYTLDPELAEALGEGVEVTDTITITDSMGGTHALVISVTGTDDAAVLTGDTTGVLTEGTGVITTSGTIELIDPDSGDTPTIENTTVTGTFGSLALVDGEWTYTLNPGAAQSLGADQSTTDTITLTDSEGKEHNIVITIEGTDDAAVVSGDFTGTVTAQIGSEITINNVFVLGDDIDVDGEQFNASSQPSSMHFDSAGFSATITDSDGQLNNSANQTIELDGQSYPVSITATVEYTDVYDNVFTMGVLSIDNGDGTSTTLLVQIDGPDILPGTDLNVVEGSYTEVSSINYVDVTDATTVSGSLSISDADANDSPTFTNTTIDGDYGTFTLTDGAWTYTLDPAKANALNDNQTEQEVFTLTASDGTVQQITVDVTGADDAAIITGDSTASITEDSGAQTASGTIAITDADTGDTPTIPNGTLTGEYGSLTLVDGAWTYTADNASIQSLADGDTATDTITVTASDGTTQDIVITITGTDDAAVISGETSGNITEDTGAQTTSGTITITDADTGDTPTIPNGTLTGEYGSLTLVDGAWTYTADSASIQSLADGDTATDTITVTASDGTTQDIVITITGTDDAAVVTGDTTGNTTDQGTTVSGSISISDVDNGETPTISNTTIEGEYGSLTLTDGEWTYTVNAENAQTLPDGESANDTFTLTASDGSTHQITVTVEGTDDAAVVTGDLSASVAEGGDASVSGSINISDPDAAVQPTLENGTIEGEYGSLTLTDGEWTYTVNPENAQSLGDGDAATDTITVTASDGSEHQITVTVTGSDDASVVTGVTSGGIDLGADTPETSTSGTLSISDVDDGDSPSFTNTTIDGDYGTFTLTDGNWTYTVDPSKADALNDNQTEQETFTLTASDGTVQQITVDVTGTDDAAVISGDFTASMTEDAGAQTASGTITITDADTGDTPTIPNGTLTGEYGSLTLVDGAWTYTADNASIQSLADGDTATDTITVTASDGTTQDIVITITGTDDAAVISGETSGNITEDTGAQTTSGTITITDADTGDTPTIPNGTLTGEYGSLTLVDGAWTYTADSASIQSLADGDTATDTITVTASDGTTQDIVITITGTDDAAVIEGNTSGAITEDTGAQTASGTITITDADTSETPTIPNGTLAGEYGSLTLVDGAWTYTADNASIQSLADGDTATDTITVTASDGTTQDIVITITGTDDAAEISGTTTGTVTEGDIGDVATATGEISIVDPDGEPVNFPDANVSGEYGSLSLVDGAWTYTLDQEAAQSLNQDQEVSDTITVTASDGSTQDIVIAVTGTNDTAEVSGTTTGEIVAPQNVEPEFYTVSGVFVMDEGYSFTSGDMQYLGAHPPTLDFQQSATTAKFFDDDATMHGDDIVNETPDDTNQYIELNGQQYIANFDYTMEYTDSSGNVYTFAIIDIDLDGDGGHGSDSQEQGNIIVQLSGPEIQPGTQLDYVSDSIVRDGNMSYDDLPTVAPVTTSGTITISDADSADNPTLPNTTVEGEYGSLTLVDGEWTYTLDQEKAKSIGADETETDVITITASDGSTHDITITLTGSDDAAEISGTTTGAVTEGDAGDVATATGEISIVDPDGEPVNFPDANVSGEYGSLSLVDGAWTYTLNQEAAQSLNQDQKVTDTITVTASDGSTQDIVISLTGTDDAAVVSGDTTSSLNLSDGITIGNAFVINENFIAEDSHFNTWDFPSTLTFNDSGTTVVINDDDSRLDGDGGSGGNSVDEINEQSTDSTQTIILDGETLSVNVDYSLQYTDTEGNVYTFAVVDVDTNANGTHSGENAESGRLLIQLDGPEITPNTSLTFVPDSYSNVTSLNYSDIAEPVTATGTLTISDADSADSPSFENTTIEGEYGSLTLVDGEWTYTLDPEKAQAIPSDATATDTITLTATDGTTQSITISLQGSDDAAVITGDTTAAITEDVGTQSASGTLNIVDPDSNQTPTFTNETITGEYGSLTMVDGEWTYTVNTDAVQSLNQDQEVTDTITVTASDGSTQDIVISLTGTDDAAEISGTTTAALTEGNAGDTITASGTLTVTDPDGDAVDFPNSSHNGTYGSLEMVDGEWTYTMNNDATQSLNEGQMVQDTITVTASDGTTQDIVIDITGSDDAAVLSGTSTATITDTSASSQNVTVGRGSDGTWDATNGDNLYLNLNNVNSDAAYSNSVGYYVLDAGGNVVRAAIIFDNAHSTNGTSVNINTAGGEKVGLFMIPDGDSKGFNVGSVSLSFGGSSVTAYQGGASSTTFVSDSSKNSGYDNEYNSGTYSAWEDIAGGGDRDHNDVTFYVSATQQQESPITASGSVSVSDVDSGDTPTLPNTTVQGEFGSLTMTNGNWTYTFDPDKASAIDEETLETIVITDSEGGKHEIVIAIQGTDDAPIVTGVFSGAVTEGDADDVITVSGTISISDADADDSPDFENTTIDGQYGSLTLEDGEWTYTLDPVKSEVLSDTDFVQDTITLTATDGTTQNVVISVTGTDDAPFVVGTNSATIIAPDSATQDYIDINNGFVLGDGYSFSGGDMQYYGNEPTLTFNDSGSTIRIYDTDSRMDGDTYSNEYVQDSSQKIEINGVQYTATYDYQLDYQDSSGNIYSFAVLDVDLDGDGGFRGDTNEQGKVIIQIDGPTITPGISMEYIRDTPNQPSSMSYSDFVDGDVPSLEAHGTLSLLDVDANDSQAVFADTTVTGQYGSLELVDGNWTYTLDPRSTPALGDNDAITEVITLTATNGAQTEVNVTIGGSENAIANTSLSGLSQSLSDVISLDDVTFSGSDSNDRIAGSDSADVLLGNAGHDVILGGGGNDFIDGGLGDDLILGGQGNDLMAGGAGSDTFAFLNGDQSTSSTPAVDHIADFDTSQDAINLSDLMQTEPSDTLESFLSLIDDGEGNAMLNIASQGDGNVDQQVVFDNMSVEDMASAYSVDISGMTSEQVSTSVIDAMIMQSKMIID
ncbi:VCBS domain-containing protein [Enterovibrio calviensis]|uniref:VCBS domain-containing protein n=1 Tax=Enterovibrio calviensis TaxID=91359 RepID=UPI0037359404